MTTREDKLEERYGFEFRSIFDNEYIILKYALLWTGLWPKQKKFIRFGLYVANVTVSVDIIARKVRKIGKLYELKKKKKQTLFKLLFKNIFLR